MKSFETYVLQHKHKNLQSGDKLKYIGPGTPRVKPNEILTFLVLKEIFGNLYIKVKEHNNILVPLRDIVKI